jgi:hypothetical protein
LNLVSPRSQRSAERQRRLHIAARAEGYGSNPHFVSNLDLATR